MKEKVKTGNYIKYKFLYLFWVSYTLDLFEMILTLMIITFEVFWGARFLIYGYFR